jgi:hypothetical protein
MARQNPVSAGERQRRRIPTTTDIIDRVLDKGIVIEYHARMCLGGIDTLVAVDARYIVTSFHTYLEYAEPLRSAGSALTSRRWRRPLLSHTP